MAAVVFDRFIPKKEDDTYHACTLHVAGEGLWATNEFLFSVFDYVFNQLGCVRCNGLVESWNERAIRLNARLGFTQEAILEKATPSGDLIVMKMFRNECQWIDKDYLDGRISHSRKAKRAIPL